ncbi:hypothetical protein GCM10027262_24460 [Nocardia tengchongensis]
MYAHSNALLTGAPGVTPILADIRKPDKVLELTSSEAGIDFSQPVGSSSRPPSLSLTATATTDALHVMVQSLRAGLAGNAPFAKVVTVGHSLTSSTSIMEAIGHHDVDGVLLTGYSHMLSVPDVLGVISSYYPAADDPGFAGRGYDSTYLVTRPGARAADFYGLNPDPRVVALDEATKETFSLTEYPDGLLATLPGETSLMTALVLLVDGSHDRMVCGAGFAACADSATLQATESPFFPPATRLRTYVLPDSGHAINLAPNTRDYHAVVIDWMKSVVGCASATSSAAVSVARPTGTQPAAAR